MFEKIKELLSISSNDEMAISQAKRVYDLYMNGVITQDNAVSNLWFSYDRVRDDSKKLLIANRIKFIERGF